MGRAPCCNKEGLKKGPWTAEEDQKLVDYIHKHGSGNWRTLPKNAGLQRCGKSCRLRWINYLRPDIKRGRFSVEEEETIIQLHGILGNKWSAIAARLPGRTDNEIKNYWNTRIRKRLIRMGIDPVTHAPRLDLLDISSILNASNHINSLHSMLGGEQTLVNPEILRLASVLSSQQRNQNYVFQDQTQYQQPPWIQTEIHGQQEADQVAACASFTNKAATTTTTAQQQLPYNGEDDYNYVPNLTNNYDDSYYLVPEQDHFLNPLSENSYPTVLSSTPSSSISTPIHSNSTFTNGGGGEEERESYGSNLLLTYESIADFLDMESSCNDIQQLLASQSEFPAVPWNIC